MGSTTGKTSITAGEPFEARAQRSEAARVVVWGIALIGILTLTGVRRMANGLVMGSDAVFYPYSAVLILAIIWQAVLWQVLRRANRQGRLVAPFWWRVAVAVDFATVAGLMAIVATASPRGPFAALTGPVLLMMPLLILTSVLRLQTRFTLFVGLAATAFQLTLTLLAVSGVLRGGSSTRVSIGREELPVQFAYPFVLLLTACAGAVVTRAVRGHVQEASDEAAAHERAENAMAAVQKDLGVARDIQAGLLPRRPPAIAGYEIAGMNRPADLTGGDYYDWQELPDGRLVVAIADVTGHGIGPALVMAVCRAYARASATLVREPEQLMERLNELLVPDLPADRFITLVIAILSPDGSVQLLSAGHGPSLLYQANGATRDDANAIQQFGGDGLPLGVTTGETYGPCVKLQLEPGDALLLLTDGFFEYPRVGDGEQYGIERLRDSMFRHVRNGVGDESVAVRLRAIDEDVRTFAAGAPQLDDMTAVLIRRTASATSPSEVVAVAS